jgi:hypothetical protein
MAFHPDVLVYPNLRLLGNMIRWEHGQIDHRLDELGGVEKMVEVTARFPKAVVLIESFTMQRFDQDDDFLYPVRVTAAYRYGIRALDIYDAEFQKPDERLTASNDRLKAWNLYVRKGGLEHARDADRHNIVWWRKRKSKISKEVRKRHEWWPHIYGPGGEVLD